MRNFIAIIISVCVVAACFCGCSRQSDARLLEIDLLCDSVPEEAMRRLDSIDQTKLSERNLNRWRLLWLKSRDKAYVAHKSDTLILDIIDYYDEHRSEGLYPEALYYGGRVYSDLGDLPTALEYFQKSLDEIPEDNAHLRFKSTVLNQTGRLLHTLRLDSAAIEYLEKSMKIDSITRPRDSDIAFTHSLMSDSYISLHNFEKARLCIKESLRLSTNLSKADSISILTSLAYLYLHEGKNDSALKIIRPLPQLVDSITKPDCLAIAAEIFREVGIPDTAYFYARMLTQLYSPNKRTGYKVIFSDKLKDFIPKDTLLKLMPEYKKTIEDYLNSHQAEQAVIQNSRYNYSKHVIERDKAERKSREYQKALLIVGTLLVVLMLISFLYIIYRKYQQSRKTSEFMEVLNISERLKNETQYSLTNATEKSEETHAEITEKIDVCSKIKLRLRKEIENIKKGKTEYLVNEEILNSDVYARLREKIKNEKCIVDSDEIWEELEKLIETASPGFFRRLDILSNGKISRAERKVAVLTKCGFTPTHISKLLARGLNTVSSQRRSLANKISEEKLSLDDFNRLIVSL